MTVANADLTFDTLRGEIQRDLMASRPEHFARLGWSAARIEEHQRDALRRLVAYAVQHSAFHRRRLADVDPTSLEPAHLDSLPVMTKAEMMDELDDVLTDPRVSAAAAERGLGETTTDPVPIAPGCIALSSGGSSGRRGVFCFDRAAIVAFLASLSRHSLARLEALGASSAITCALVSAPTAVHATGAAPAFTAGSTVPLSFIPVPVTLPFSEIVDRLNQLQAPLLYGYPSMLTRLADEQRAGRLRLELFGVTSTSETLLPELRENIRDGFGAPIIDTFGATEGLVGVSAPDDDVLVFNSDGCIVELVDDEYRPVPDGTPSTRILVTNLTNRLQPLIRYEITDSFVRQAADPAHGHLRARVEGRADDVLRYGEVGIHPLVVRAVMVKTPSVADYQVRQTPLGMDVLAISAGTLDDEGLRERLSRALADAGLRAPEVTVTRVERLARDARTGKVRRFQPLP